MITIIIVILVSFVIFNATLTQWYVSERIHRRKKKSHGESAASRVFFIYLYTSVSGVGSSWGLITIIGAFLRVPVAWCVYFPAVRSEMRSYQAQVEGPY